MKKGCNFIDINNIRAYVNAGNTDAAQIGQRLGIAPATVQKFVDTMVTPVAPETPSEDNPTRRRRAAGA
jgi:hypothetical protein